ncbi:MAG: hypothetical protein LWY06_05300 [Firmicutes bacterium]|nr:hypothetical protein [Bacillota bacterium]
MEKKKTNTNAIIGNITLGIQIFYLMSLFMSDKIKTIHRIFSSSDLLNDNRINMIWSFLITRLEVISPPIFALIFFIAIAALVYIFYRSKNKEWYNSALSISNLTLIIINLTLSFSIITAALPFSSKIDQGYL